MGFTHDNGGSMADDLIETHAVVSNPFRARFDLEELDALCDALVFLIDPQQSITTLEELRRERHDELEALYHDAATERLRLLGGNGEAQPGQCGCGEYDDLDAANLCPECAHCHKVNA